MRYIVYYVGFGKIHHTVEVEAEDENDAISKANDQVKESGLDFADEFKLLGLEKYAKPAE